MAALIIMGVQKGLITTSVLLINVFCLLLWKQVNHANIPLLTDGVERLLKPSHSCFMKGRHNMQIFEKKKL